MRSRQLAWVLLCLSSVYGCGGTSPGSPDATDVPKDTPVEKVDVAPEAKPDLAADTADAKDAADAPATADTAKDGTDSGGDVDVGGPPPCKTASECPGQDSECQHRTCVAGACGTANEALGKVLATQIIGDCKVRQCAANGTPTTVIDDRDIPDDINPCTHDTCTSGMSGHTALAKDTACGGGKLCNATGQCVGCTIAEQCPGTDNACRTRTCTQSVCGVTFVAAGTKLTDPTSGDCKGLQCDGQGIIQTVAVSTDVPADNNACTLDQCNGTTPSHQPVLRNTSCGTGLVCDGATHCVACLTASTCPGVDSPCQSRTCNNGACGIANAAAGKPAGTQTSGDCKKQQCNGSGAIVTVNDDSDPLVDNNPCTRDVCTAGTPSNPALLAHTNCGPNLQCDGKGLCVGCLSVADCPGTDTVCKFRTCTDGRCGTGLAAAGTPAAEQIASDCKQNQCDGKGAVLSVLDNMDTEDDHNPCTNDACAAGKPTHLPTAIHISCGPKPLECDGAGKCVNCVSASECGPDTECITNTCDASGTCQKTIAVGKLGAVQPPNDCNRKECNSLGTLVDVPDSSDPPVDMFECTRDVCTAGMPSNPAVDMGIACSQAGGKVCNGLGSCVECLSPSTCPGMDNECNQRTCILGMCGAIHAAVNKPANDQVAGDCQQRVCDGNGGFISIADNNDEKDDGNICTDDLCTNGSMSNPIVVNRSCADAKVCKSDGTCVECNNDIQCGSLNNSACMTHTCVGDVCMHTSHPGVVVPSPVGDCTKTVCNSTGVLESLPDDMDIPNSNKPCVVDGCVGGQPHPTNKPDTEMCAGDQHCDGNGSCVGCNTSADCGPTDDCQTNTCNAAKTCTHTNTLSDTAIPQMAGDCQRRACDGNGQTLTPADPEDFINDGNACTNDACKDGVSTNTPVPDRRCGDNRFCSAQGTCVGCNSDDQCAPMNTDCQSFACVAHVCSVATKALLGTPLPKQKTGDCQTAICDGNGGTTTQDTNSDKPVDGNDCTQDLCTNGVPTNPNVTAGAACSQNSGSHCDRAIPSQCVPTFMVVRVGDPASTTSLASTATAVFVEEFTVSDGTPTRRVNLPTTAPVQPAPPVPPDTNNILTLGGTPGSEGGLSLSGDGHSVTLVGYKAALGTTAKGSDSATNPRIVGKIGVSGPADTSTSLGAAAFSKDNVRSAVTNDGNQVWSAGNASAGSNRGVFYTSPFGTTLSANTNKLVDSKSTRVCQIASGQLYCTAANTPLNNVFQVATGLPTNSMMTPTVFPAMTLAGMPTMDLPSPAVPPSPFSFAFIDADNNGQAETLYVADDRRVADGGGIQKWVFADSSWSLTPTTFSDGTNGVRGLAAYVSGTTVVLIATTAMDPPVGAPTVVPPNAIVRLIDDQMSAPSTVHATTLVVAGSDGQGGASNAFRGVALSPH